MKERASIDHFSHDLADDSKLPVEPTIVPKWSSIAFFMVSSLNAMGVVYGDIGTSPLYTLKSLFESGPAEPDQVKGAICLILYSLTWVVCLKYMIFILMADYRGEGGVFALVSLLLHSDRPKLTEQTPLQVKLEDPSTTANEELPEHIGKYSTKSIDNLKFSKFLSKPQVKQIYSNLALIGAGLLIGDGVITPSISVLSALEGIETVSNSLTPAVVPITCVILVFLFALQQYGTAKVGMLFGPVMLLWFVSIGAVGLYQLSISPAIFEAVNPYYAVLFFQTHGIHAWHLMGSVVLCVTGCEAMYADMGHFGKNPVRVSWLIIVYPSLILNYLGQGSLLLRNPSSAANPFYEAVPKYMFVPMLILAALATVIASQALISGAFSITEQAISLGTCPRMKVIHTSDTVMGQIYIPTLNWMLMIACLILVITFKSSTALSGAYGLAVCGDMTLTSVFFLSLARFRWKWNILPWLILAIGFFTFDFAFLSSAVLKIPEGGYVPLVIASVVSFTMYTWREGRNLMHKHIKQLPEDEVYDKIKSWEVFRTEGTSVFLSSESEGLPNSLGLLIDSVPYLSENVIILTIKHKQVPYVKPEKNFIVESLQEGFVRVIAQYGYRESYIKMEDLLQRLQPFISSADFSKPRFYLSSESIASAKDRWTGHRLFVKYFSLLHAISFSNAKYFRIPMKCQVVLGERVLL